MLSILGLLVLVSALFLLAISLRFAVPLVYRYTCGLARGYGVGKEPQVADVVRPPVKQPKDAHEPAYDHYLFGQAWRDARHTHVLGVRAFRETFTAHWTRVLDKYLRDEYAGQLPPPNRSTTRGIGVLMMCGLAFGALLAAAFLVLVGLAGALVLSQFLAVVWVLLYALRFADTVVLRVRGVTRTCKHCGKRLPQVIHECDKCGSRHKDLRPGRYGVIRRTCACGNRLPTMALVKNYELTTRCPHCDKPLAGRTGRSPEVVLPVFGAPLAGKTQLIIVLIMALEAVVKRTGGSFDYADQATHDQVVKSRRILATTNRTEKTIRVSSVTSTLVHPAYSLHVGPKRGRARLLHVFDAAGESFKEANSIEQLSYLLLARTFVFVIDPLSIESLWQAIEPGRQAKLKDKRAQVEPKVVFAETLQTITDMGVETSNARLAVAVSKADLVADVVRDIDGRNSQAIRSWLASMNQGNMLRAMDLHFSQVSFFLTSATMDTDDQADASIQAFVRQTLSAEGLRLSGTQK